MAYTTFIFISKQEHEKVKIKKPACFVAGTLVHTKEGLRPIEEIKVGDYVLSKPESGSGELAYKRVTKTFVHENREVFGVVYGIKDNGGLLVSTAEHPFWIPKMRVDDPNDRFGSMTIPHGKWITAGEIFKSYDNYYKGKGKYERYFLSSFDGKEYGVAESTPICTATDNPKNNTLGYAGPGFGVLWEVTGDPQRRQEAKGGGVDFRVAPPQYIRMLSLALNKKTRNTDKATWVEGSTEQLTQGYQPKRCTVYNLEVEEFHTYFVGEHGIWVHNTKEFYPISDVH